MLNSNLNSASFKVSIESFKKFILENYKKTKMDIKEAVEALIKSLDEFTESNNLLNL